MIVIAQATTYERLPIQTMHMKKVSGKLFFHFGFSQSGIVRDRVKWMGHETIHLSFTQLLLLLGNSLRYSNSEKKINVFINLVTIKLRYYREN